MAMLRDVEVPDQYLDAVAFEPLGIKDEFARLGADCAYWNEVYANALRAELEAGHALDQVRAATLLEIRATAQIAGEKLTESVVDAKVTIHPAVIAATEKSILAQVEKTRIRGRLNALGDKKEGTISYGAHVREEMKGDATMRDQYAGSTRVRHQGVG